MKLGKRHLPRIVAITLMLGVSIGMHFLVYPTQAASLKGDVNLMHSYQDSTFSNIALYSCIILIPFVLLIPLSPYVDRVLTVFLAIAACQLLTTTIKLSAGRPRPYALTVCNATTSLNDHYEILTCPDSETRLSFVSGHTSMMVVMTAALVLQWFEFGHTSSPWVVFTSQLILFCLINLTVFCAVSRVTDHKHFPSDVVGGAVVGIASAMWAVRL